jgi:hypothetical protein
MFMSLPNAKYVVKIAVKKYFVKRGGKPYGPFHFRFANGEVRKAD